MPDPMGIGPSERLKPEAGRLASPVLGGGGSETVSCYPTTFPLNQKVLHIPDHVDLHALRR